VTDDDDKVPEGPLDPFDDGVELGSGPDDELSLLPPSTATRLVSSMIDMLFIGIFIVVPSTIIPLLILRPVKGKTLTPAQNRTIVVVSLIVSLVVFVLCALMERRGFGLPGRRLLRLRLVTATGERPSLARLLGRFAPLVLIAIDARVVLLLLAGTFLSAVNPLRRDALDYLAGTRVVAATG
jgi:uncharacterized RDD family membrane protein YckC